MTCKKCDTEFHVESDKKLICVYSDILSTLKGLSFPVHICKVQLNLLDEEKRVNDQRIKKLEEHKKLKYLPSEETMKQIERNSQIEYKKRDGIIKTMNSKVKF